MFSLLFPFPFPTNPFFILYLVPLLPCSWFYACFPFPKAPSLPLLKVEFPRPTLLEGKVETDRGFRGMGP